MNELSGIGRKFQNLGLLGCYFNEITQHVVVFYFQGFNAGACRIILLQIGDDLLGVVSQFTIFIKLGRIAFGDKTAITGKMGQFRT